MKEIYAIPGYLTVIPKCKALRAFEAITKTPVRGVCSATAIGNDDGQFILTADHCRKDVQTIVGQWGGLFGFYNPTNGEEYVLEFQQNRDDLSFWKTTKISFNGAKKIAVRYNITGFPVVDKENKVLGILTNRDIRFLDDNSIKVSEVMTKENLAIVKEPINSKEAKQIMAKRRIEKLLVVDESNYLIGLLTIKDIEKSVLNPLACKDELGRLRCAAASSTGNEGYERSVSLIDSGADVIVIDTAHGHSLDVIKSVKRLKKEFSNTQVIAGNVVTPDATKELIDVGADGIKVGIGPGSICTTRIIAGVGMPQLTAIMNCAKEADLQNIPVIADGGIRFSGDFAKSIASGASCAMIGSLFAGTDESPGEISLYQGRSFKNYRGMGSLGAMARGSADRYFQKEVQADKLVPEGIEGQVPYKGSVNNIIYQLVGGLKASMGYTGNKNINQMKNGCKFVKISGAGLSESHVHDVRITNESPNYSNDK